MTNLVKEFAQKYQDRYRILEEISRQGKKVIGWVCTYVPEEILYAGGMHPFRIVGRGGETSKADAYLYSNICTFVRSCMEEGLSANLPFLSGFVTCNTCDHIRRLFDVWLKYVDTPYTKLISLPCTTSETSLDYFKTEIVAFKEELERHFAVSITEKSLREAIKLFNQTRSLLRELYELRKSPNPPISGAEVSEVVMAGMVLSKPEYNRQLEALLAFLKDQPGVPAADGPRLMVIGSELDSSDFIRVIEEQGGLVVTDDLCCGTRYFWDLVEEEGEPMEALARRYLTKMPCARMHPAKDRLKRIQELIESFEVQGVVYQSIKFCDLHAGVFPVIRNGLKELGVPVLQLEREYALSSVGQLKTRIRAFYEQLEA